MNESTIDGWAIAETKLDDGSSVYDLVGASGDARVTIGCNDKEQAERLLAELTGITCSAEAM